MAFYKSSDSYRKRSDTISYVSDVSGSYLSESSGSDYTITSRSVWKGPPGCSCNGGLCRKTCGR